MLRVAPTFHIICLITHFPSAPAPSGSLSSDSPVHIFLAFDSHASGLGQS